MTNFSRSPTSAFAKVAYWLATPWQKWRSSGFRKLESRLGESNPGVRPESRVHTTPLAGVWLFAIKSVSQTATGQQHECDFSSTAAAGPLPVLAWQRAKKEFVGVFWMAVLSSASWGAPARLCGLRCAPLTPACHQLINASIKSPASQSFPCLMAAVTSESMLQAPPPAAAPFTSVSSCLLLSDASLCFFLLISFPFCFPRWRPKRFTQHKHCKQL